MGYINYAYAGETADAYGFKVLTKRKRKRGCKCKPPCQRSFRCTTCRLYWAYCVGGDDTLCAKCHVLRRPYTLPAKPGGGK